MQNTDTPLAADTVTFERQSQLAKLLANENLVVRHSPNVTTAHFELSRRELVLPVWRNVSPALYDMLVIHETGHALETPAEGFLDRIRAIAARVEKDPTRRARATVTLKDYLNVIEDVRIDKLQKRRYPGCKRDYIVGYKELWERDFFGANKSAVDKMSFIDRVNIQCKAGTSVLLHIKFTAKERDLLRRIENSETYDEVLALTEETYLFARENLKTQIEGVTLTFGSSSLGYEEEESDEDEYEEEDGDASEDEDDEELASSVEESDEEAPASKDLGEDSDTDFLAAPSEEELEAAAEKRATDEASQEEQEEEDEEGPSTGRGEPREDDGPVPAGSETQAIFDKRASELVQKDNLNYVYVRQPKPILSEIIDDFPVVMKEQSADRLDRFPRSNDVDKDGGLKDFLAQEARSIEFMVKEFEAKKAADAYVRSMTHKTGVLDTTKLHSYKYNEDLFKKVTMVPDGKNHGFIMYLDWSGSMHGRLANTIKQLITLTMFCRRVNIPFEVYAFKTAYASEVDPQFSKEAGELIYGGLKLRNLLSSRMKLSEMNEAMKNLWYQALGGAYRCELMNGTPLNQAILCAIYMVPKFRDQHRLQVVNTIFLTDGGADGGSLIPNGHEGSQNYYSNFYVLQDDVTGKVRDIGKYAYSGSSDNRMTRFLLETLKERTGCNLIGFYIPDSKFGKVMSEFFGGITRDSAPAQYAGLYAMWKNDGFITIKDMGYDSYYVLNPINLSYSTEELAIDANTSKKKMVQEFSRFNAAKRVNRVLLSQFVKQIVG